MGETADQTREEIVKLRAEMSGKVVELRQAAQRPIRIAKMVAICAVAVVVVGGVAMVVISARRRAERKSLRGQLKMATDAAANPDKTAKQVKATVDKTIDKTRAKLRDELREELKKELRDERPLHERVLTTALKSAATAAVPIVLKQLESRTAAGKTSTAP
jgi:flagellar biosynthesis/type III secretory pathway M-ring protein FliF/YscJ